MSTMGRAAALPVLATPTRPPVAWREMSACHDLDPEVFFPAMKDGAAIALSYCKVCPVRDPCLALALQMGEQHGVWGGTTEQQRRLLILSSARLPAERIIDLRQ